MFNIHLKLVLDRKSFDILNIDLYGDNRAIKYRSGSIVKETLYDPSTMHIIRGTGMDDINDNEIFEGDTVITNKGKYKVFYSEDSSSFSLDSNRINFELTTDVVIDENVEVVLI